MKNPFSSHILPVFPAGAGILGLLLRIWLLAATDEKGLLPANHFADKALYILTALVLVILFLATRTLTPRPINKRVLRLTNACACIMGGIGLLLTAVLLLTSSPARMARLAMIATGLGGIVMLLMAVLHFCRRRVHFLLPAVVTVALMLNAVAQCQVWGAVPQLQIYFFPLLASIFLILCTYQKTALTAKQGNPRLLAFFSQASLFFCCVSLNAPQLPLHLGMMFWAALQLYPCVYQKKEG
jgi:cytochrome bd-type quinol oxidase subunit 2